MGDTRLDERKFGMLKRASASQPAPKHIYKPQSRLNDILFLSKSRDGRSLSNDRAVIWRMSVKVLNYLADIKSAGGVALRVRTRASLDPEPGAARPTELLASAMCQSS